MKRFLNVLNGYSLLFSAIVFLGGWTTNVEAKNQFHQTNAPFVGAELFSNLAEEGHTRITLKKYYSADLAEAPATEFVVIHERELAMVYKYLQLDLISESEIKDESPPPTCGPSTTIQLPIMPAGYDIVWMQPQLDEMGAGLPPDEQSNLSLSIHIPDPMTARTNAMAEIAPLQKYIFCSGQTYELPLATDDPDGDRVQYTLSKAHSFLPLTKETASNQAAPVNMGILKSEADNLSLDIRLRRPPFQPLSETMGFTYYELLAKNKSASNLDSKTGILQFSPPNTGKYLIGITSTETREGTSISNHQAVFLVDVL